MGRRRRKQEESSFVEDCARLIILASKRSPLAGLLFCGIFIALGGYWIGNPKMLLGFAKLIGIVTIFAGLGCGGLALLGLLRSVPAAADAGGSMIARLIGDLRRTSHSPGTRAAAASSAGVWTIDAVHALSWQQFEQLVADLFRRQGYTVGEHGKASQSAGTGDGGVDLILTDPRSPGAEFLVQCKQYKSWDVGEPKVREFYGAMAAWRTRCEGIIVTCGRYTLPAKDFAKDKPIRLIDGEGLIRLLNEHNAISPAVLHTAAPAVQAASLPPVSSTPPTVQMPGHVPAATDVPACPKCKVAMVRRVAGKGPRKGLAFWGCANYPVCKVCIDIAS